MRHFRTLLTTLLLIVPITTWAQQRFSSQLTLPTGQTLVIQESDLEARSIGSFSVRLYQAAAAPDTTTFFSDGLIRPRDGMVEKAYLADLNDDNQPELIVQVRSAGTGNYLSLHVFNIQQEKISVVMELNELAATVDPIAALKKEMPLH